MYYYFSRYFEIEKLYKIIRKENLKKIFTCKTFLNKNIFSVGL